MRFSPFHDAAQNRIWLASPHRPPTCSPGPRASPCPPTPPATNPNGCGYGSWPSPGGSCTPPPPPQDRSSLALGRGDHHRARPADGPTRPLTTTPHPNDQGPGAPADHAEPAMAPAHRPTMPSTRSLKANRDHRTIVTKDRGSPRAFTVVDLVGDTPGLDTRKVPAQHGLIGVIETLIGPS